jgi:TRAP-type mannitol/chloroaromatic compound transport system permease small subunit
MLLPISARFSQGRRGTAVFFVLATAVVIAGCVFASLAPDLSAPPDLAPYTPFAAGLIVLTLLIAIVGGPKASIAILEPLFTFIVRTVGRSVMWLVLLMALAQIAVVIFRYVFGVSFIVMQESITYMHGAVFLLAAGYALLTDDHVRVDILYRGASPRQKARMDFWGTYLLLLPTCLLILWTSAPYVANAWAVHEGSNEQSGIQALYILKSFIPAFAVFVAMAGFSVAARASETLRQGG